MRESSHTIKAVTFDLWETLLLEEDGASAERTSARCRKLAQTLNGFGARVSIEQVGDALNNTVSSLLEKWNKNKTLPTWIRYNYSSKTCRKNQPCQKRN